MTMRVTILATLATMLLGAFGCGGAECPPPRECPVCPEAAPVPPPQPPPPPPQPVATGPMVEEWIQLPVRILFTTAGAELSAENRALLDQAVQTLRTREDIVRVRIEGHTDTRGRDANNAELSLQRAEQVKAYLISQGVPAQMLETAGYGAQRPLVIEGNYEENRAQNRRVEFSALIRRPREQAGQPL